MRDKPWPIIILVVVLGVLYYAFTDPGTSTQLRDFLGPVLRMAQSLVEIVFGSE